MGIGEKVKVFISWSGSHSQVVALALEDLLLDTLHPVEPFVSESGIEVGALWFSTIADELTRCRFAVFCLTQENFRAPWVNFEAGAVAFALDPSNSTDHTKHVAPYLLDVQRSAVKGPLSAYQSVVADRDGTEKLLLAINRSLGSLSRDPERLRKAFSERWPEYESILDQARRAAAEQSE